MSPARGPLLPDDEVRLLRDCEREAAYGNPATVRDGALSGAADRLLDRGWLAWAGLDGTHDAYEWTEAGAQALALHEQFVAGRTACLGGHPRWSVPNGQPDSYRAAWFAGFDAVNL